MKLAKLNRLEYYRRLYAQLKPGWQHATERYQHWVAARLTPTSRVLDLGCGRGGIAERLYTRAWWTGIDPDWQSVQEHRVAILPRGQANANWLPFEDQSFDLVVASWVLEHLAAPQAAFREISRVLRSEGRFIFLTPNARHPIPRLAQALAQFQRHIVPLVYGRAGVDAFPMYYRANTPERIAQLATQTSLRLAGLMLIDDPAYFSWNDWTFTLATYLELLIPAYGKVHLLGEYVNL